MGSESGMIESDPLPLAMTAYFAMVAVMVGLWVVQRRIRNAAIGDVGWCAGLIGTVLWYATQAPVPGERILLTVMLVTLYAGRLGHYILYDRVIGKEEDPRYKRLRKKWGTSEQVNMFAYFQVQAFAVVAFSLPFMVVLWNPRIPSSLVEMLGLLIWGIAVAGESKADRQLAHFRADPRNQGRVCREGLWKYSRHPNYFFEWLHWCSYVVMTMGAAGWIFTWIGPIGMWVALMYVTGIPRTEEQARSSRGDEYKIYQATTNEFFPWHPRPTSGVSARS